MLVSVVLPVYNSAGTLEKQLARLCEQRYTGPWELVIVDNGSTDGSGDLARACATQHPHVTVVEVPSPRNACIARNAGADVARGDLLAFCDADDEVAAGWVEAMVVAAADSDMVGGWLDHRSLNRPPTTAWRPDHLPTDRLPLSLGFLPFATAANCAIWRSVLEAVGGWNAAYRGSTDVDLSWRVQLAGYQLSFAPDAVVHYRFRTSLRELARQYFRIGSAHPQLYRDFRGHGVPRSLGESLRTWAWLLVRAPTAAVSRERRGRWLRIAAFRWGRLWGSVRTRVLYP